MPAIKKEKSQHGGARPNSGPKPRYGEPTVYIGFRVPASKAKEVKEYVEQKLQQYKVM